MSVEIREMRPTDVVKYSRFCVPKFYGVVFVEDGEKIGAGAIIWGDGNRPFLCLEITERLRKMPVLMTKTAKRLIAATIQACGEVFTIEDKDEATSPRWLERLGFVPTGEDIKGERVLRHG